MTSLFRMQSTIAEPTTVTGIGFWSGRQVRVEFHPAPVNSGVVFVRTDLPAPNRISAIVSHRIEQPRRTTLSNGTAQVEMVEHIMAALAGLCIDNCEVRVDASEMPGCDGSSAMFVSALDSVKRISQEAPRGVLHVSDRVRVTDGDSWVEAQPARGGEYRLKYRLDYGSESPIGRQTCELDVTPASFRKELASARTFLLEAEAVWLQEQGLGGHVSTSDLLVFGDTGPIDNTLRFDDECVRHKTLDMVGDFALAGCDIVGRIIAHRTGHRLNAELVRALLNENQIVHTGKAA